MLILEIECFVFALNMAEMQTITKKECVCNNFKEKSLSL